MYSSVFNYLDGDFILRSDCPYDDKLVCSSKSVDFRTHHCVLSAASQLFEGMLSLPQPESAKDTIIPIIPFPEPASVLETLLRYIYPVEAPVIRGLDELAPALEAARKYDFAVAIEGLRRRLIAPEFLEAYPLRVYGLATQYELIEEAAIASRALLNTPLSAQEPHEDLKHISAYDYHRLVVLREMRAHAAIALLTPPRDLKCMQCNGRWDKAREPPRWWADYRERAKEELRVRPTSAVIFSLPFLQQSAQVGCTGCAASILCSSWFFSQLRQSIDDLPATI
ncbi:hypothetical protein TRAPUB_14011 [Trametes pubescens]|uniref:BTB domain-containing protein n=1 Tax=Trametes pubescens TaxID=154538 RepID=A0A1M2VPR3_TRAPU|nr:hypothetical protein TRAPUB_14011 [Trametes pubescens]